MELARIEEFLFSGHDAHFVTAFTHDDCVITLKLTPVEARAVDETIATFANSSALDIWQDPSEAPEWPLDIVGCDCYSRGQRWRFVLNCDTIEWTWESDWPSVNK